MRIFGFATVVVALTLVGVAQAGETVPIVLEGSVELDACGEVGRVAGLHAHGKEFLDVRAGPGSSYEKLDELIKDDQVYICSERGEWIGVVYSKAGRDCGVSSPLPKSREYAGPCPSGWVHGRWIRPTAG